MKNVTVSMEEDALEWVRIGSITDSKTIIALMWLDKMQTGGWDAA